MLFKKIIVPGGNCRALLAFLFLAGAVLVLATSPALAAGQPKTVAEIALYQGPDREKLLIEGAKREGNFTLYISNSWIAREVSKEFEKKYPFIKVVAWHGQSDKLVPRVLEEFAAGQLKADAIESSHDTVLMLNRRGVFQEYYTPEAAYYPEAVKEKGKNGIYCLGNREIYNSLGFNTKLISPAEAPKTYHDLLDPKWKGKMSITGVSTGVRWIGSILEAMGLEYLEKLSRQNIKVHKVGPVGLITLVIAGEVPLSPTITSFNVFDAKRKGAPVEWRPLEPVLTSLGLSGITATAPHPHAAMLFLDYLFSTEGQRAAMQGGLSSPRKDIGGLETKFKKSYVGAGYSIEEFEKKYAEWETLLKRLFIQKR